MRKFRILRVGICGCEGADFYRGALNGRQISVRQLADVSLHRPHEYVLREVHVPENGKWDAALRLSRCHFHLDLHELRRRFLVELVGVQLTFNGLDQLPNLRMWPLRRGGYFECEWRVKRRPSARQVTAAIKRLICLHSTEELRYWLDQGRRPKAAFQLG